MNCDETERNRPQGKDWVIGYGNENRRDDGIGPFTALLAAAWLSDRTKVRCQTAPFLEVGLIADMERADRIVLVDACVDCPEPGWRVEPIEPAPDRAPVLSHDIQPAWFLSLFENVHGCRPQAWLAVVRGENFGLGQGLTSVARARARETAARIAELLSKED